MLPPRSCLAPLALSSALLVALAGGCANEPMNIPGSPTTSAPETSPPPGQQGPALRKVIGEKTQDIKDLQAEQQANPGEVQIASQKITARDPITLQGNAYVTAVGKISIDQISYAIRLFEAQEGRYPADYDEFMQRIIRENNIVLPQLPAYQEYAYDAQNHKLVVLEFPDRKEALLEQVRGGGRP